MLAVSFHAELGADDRLHRLFLGLVGESRGGPATGPAAATG